MTIPVALLSAPCGTRSVEVPPGHFVYFGRDHERAADSAFLAHPRIVGAQLKYTWRELEPERDRYDFAPIREQLALLRRHGKRLFIQLSDVTFTERVPVPEYLLSDPAFHGGAARKYEGSTGVFDGWVARRWDPAVRARFARLLDALAEEIGVGVGGPDVLPYRRGQQANSLPLIAARSASVVAGMAVQDGNLADLDPATGRPVTVDALYRYAADRLRLDYIFWGIEEPYFTRDVLPYLRGLSPD